MTERVRLRKSGNGGGGSYFSRPKTNLEFVPTGCKILDLALGGGWAEGRIANVIGDKSTGKTLLAIEASANFARKHPRGRIRYREAEAAFDRDYAEALGMPVGRVDFGNDPIETVEDLFEELDYRCQHSKYPELFIVDSLDALTDRGEMERDIDKGSYGAEKAKKMSQLFRRLVRGMASTNITLMMISQVRDKIGVQFGRKWSRTGGRAMDFYASQVIYLAQVQTLSKVVGKIKRPIGIEIRARCEKNKVSLPFREAQFPIVFGYGIDDYTACADWMKEVGREKEVPADVRRLKEHGQLGTLHAIVEKAWGEIEDSFLPKRRKYQEWS